MQEYEVKFLDVNVEDIRSKLRALGAEKVGEYLYKRNIYDYSDGRLGKAEAWVRLRDEGEQVTLTYKQNHANGKDVTEFEVTVSSFDSAHSFLLAIGLEQKRYTENRRERWVKDAWEFDIDFWPGIPPYLEIESSSWEAVELGINALGLNPADTHTMSVVQVYRHYGLNSIDKPVLTFETEVPKLS